MWSCVRWVVPGVSKYCCATFFKGKQSKNFLRGLLTFEDKGTMILQSIWNHPVTQGHKPEELNGCQNLRVCTVVSVWYWSSMNCIFQYYRCLKSMHVVLLGVICVCLLGHHLYVVFQGGIKSAKHVPLVTDFLQTHCFMRPWECACISCQCADPSAQLCLSGIHIRTFIARLCLSGIHILRTFMSSSPGSNLISILCMRLFV